MRKPSRSRSEILFAGMCPLGPTHRQARSYPIRKDGKIFFAGSWRTIPAAIKKRAGSKAFHSGRYQKDPAYRERKKRQNREWYANNASEHNDRRRIRHRGKSSEEKRELSRRRVESARKDPDRLRKQREWYWKNREEYLRAIYEGRDRRHPDRIIRRAIDDFRGGKISFSGLGRRCDLALALADEAADPSRKRSNR